MDRALRFWQVSIAAPTFGWHAQLPAYLLFPCFSAVPPPWVRPEHRFCHHLCSSALMTTSSIMLLKIPVSLKIRTVFIPSQRKQSSVRAGSNGPESATPQSSWHSVAATFKVSLCDQGKRRGCRAGWPAAGRCSISCLLALPAIGLARVGRVLISKFFALCNNFLSTTAYILINRMLLLMFS